MRRRIVRLLVPALALSLTACSGLLRWDKPSKHAHAHAAKPRATAVRADGPDEYRVRSGDTIYAIAFRNQLDYRELAGWNGIGPDYLITPGQTLRLKPAAATSATPGTPKPAATPRGEIVVVKPVAPVIAPAPAAEPLINGFEWLWPTTGTILRTYAPKDGFKGLDFGGNLGQPVFAAAPGRVVYSGDALKGYGELIIIKHNDSYLSAYGYNRKRNVNEGDVVTAGQPIAELGLGPENKPFLHFEIRERGQPVDPMRFLPKRETTPGAH
jgi:lipoprotein NlpD